jgi:hypothetical protein
MSRTEKVLSFLRRKQEPVTIVVPSIPERIGYALGRKCGQLATVIRQVRVELQSR